jgi:hypothetical protein
MAGLAAVNDADDQTLYQKARTGYGSTLECLLDPMTVICFSLRADCGLH